jgi:hypothetical protein
MTGFFGTFVIPPTLATPTDLATWTGTTAPVNAPVLLRSASMLVLRETEGAYYTIDPLTGLPTDAMMINALRDATCIQAAAWAAINYNPLAGGVVTATVASSKKIGTASIVNEGAIAAAASQAAAGQTLVPEAITKLQQNNLLGSAPWTFG